MTRSTFDAGVFERDDERAVGHWYPFARAALPLPTAVPMVAAGGLHSCLDDALRFVQFQLRDGEGVVARDLLVEQRTMQFPLPSDCGVPVRLLPIGPDLYLSAVGEVLDLGSSNPRYANVELTKVPE